MDFKNIGNAEKFVKYWYDISMKFWISFVESKWNFNKNVHKHFFRILKILFRKKHEETSSTFYRNTFQDEENLEKIPCKCWRNLKMTLENFWLILKIMKKYLRNVKILCVNHLYFSTNIPFEFHLKTIPLLKQRCNASNEKQIR